MDSCFNLIVRPFANHGRIAHTDNYYTWIPVLLKLRAMDISIHVGYAQVYCFSVLNNIIGSDLFFWQGAEGGALEREFKASFTELLESSAITQEDHKEWLDFFDSIANNADNIQCNSFVNKL
jgi:hypothetical protein